MGAAAVRVDGRGAVAVERLVEITRYLNRREGGRVCIDELVGVLGLYLGGVGSQENRRTVVKHDLRHLRDVGVPLVAAGGRVCCSGGHHTLAGTWVPGAVPSAAPRYARRVAAVFAALRDAAVAGDVEVGGLAMPSGVTPELLAQDLAIAEGVLEFDGVVIGTLVDVVRGEGAVGARSVAGAGPVEGPVVALVGNRNTVRAARALGLLASGPACAGAVASGRVRATAA